MANSDVIITEAGNYAPTILDKKRQLALLALSLYSVENGLNLSTTSATIKSLTQLAQTALKGIPATKFLPVLIAEYWTAVNTAGSSDLINTSLATKMRSVAYSYLLSMDEDALRRFCLYMNGRVVGVLS